MMLKDEVAVVYGAGGAVGGSVARAFAREGARVFVTGRHREPVDAIGSTDPFILGAPLVDLPLEKFSLPITSYTRSYFLTARLAARRMLPNRSGVIMTVTTLHSRTGLPLAGGIWPVPGRQESLTRQLSAELSPHGIRVVGLRPQAMPESLGSRRRFYESRAPSSGMTWEQFQGALASRTHPRRLLTLDEMSNVAAFMASDTASVMTRTTVNLTLGSLDD